jgi:hypothetical protein
MSQQISAAIAEGASFEAQHEAQPTGDAAPLLEGAGVSEANARMIRALEERERNLEALAEHVAALAAERRRLQGELAEQRALVRLPTNHVAFALIPSPPVALSFSPFVFLALRRDTGFHREGL